MDPTSPLPVLVAAARDGDQGAWDAIVDRFIPLVFSVISRHRLRGADADDVNQTVWLRLVEHLGDIRDPMALPGWIATTARNECLRHIDRSRRTTPVDPQESSALDEEPDPADLDDSMLRAEALQALRDGLAELTPSQRDLLLLLLEDPPIPYAEISERLGIPVGSIGPTRGRALEKLRQTSALSGLMPEYVTGPRR